MCRSSAKAAATGPLVKAYVEVSGDVHTVRVAAGAVSSLSDLRRALRKVCLASGAPELQKLDFAAADIQFLSGGKEASGTPRLVTEATDTDELRKAKAFRVVF